MKCLNCGNELDFYEFLRFSDDVNVAVCPKCKIRINLREFIKERKVTQEFLIMTLCGSTKFKEEFEAAQKEFSLRGYLVISVGCFLHREDDLRIEEQKELLDRIHLQKIDLADIIFIISPDGYIGESTAKEIEYAKEKGKLIVYQTHSFLKK